MFELLVSPPISVSMAAPAAIPSTGKEGNTLSARALSTPIWACVWTHDGIDQNPVNSPAESRGNLPKPPSDFRDTRLLSTGRLLCHQATDCR